MFIAISIPYIMTQPVVIVIIIVKLIACRVCHFVAVYHNFFIFTLYVFLFLHVRAVNSMTTGAEIYNKSKDNEQ